MHPRDNKASHDSPRYRGLIFDVGGTLMGLLDYKPFQDFLAHASLPAADEDARQLHRRLISVILARRDEAQGLGVDENDLYAWWQGNFAGTWTGRPDLAEEMYRWWRQDRFDRTFDDVAPTLEALQGLGMPMGILSNWTSDLEDLLQRLNLRRYFDFVIASATVGMAKPDPRVFGLAAKNAGQPGHRLLYIGDHFGDDIEGSRVAGWDGVLIDRGDWRQDTPCARIDSLLDLLHYIYPPSGPAQAIIFDMDGVVLNSPAMHLRTWQRTLEPLGIEISAGDLYPLEGMPTERTAQKLTEQALGRACSNQEAHRLATTKRALFRQMFTPTFVPGIVPLLHDLQGRGYQLGLVTGSAQSVVDESLAPTGLTDLFSTIITGDQVVQGKPDPEPFQIAAARLGLDPDQCLVIENSPLGTQSAKAAGMSCLAIETTLPGSQLRAADQVFPNVTALRAWLLKRWKAARIPTTR